MVKSSLFLFHRHFDYPAKKWLLIILSFEKCTQDVSCYCCLLCPRASPMAQLPPPLLGCGDTAVPGELLCIQHAWPGRENGSKETLQLPESISFS